MVSIRRYIYQSLGNAKNIITFNHYSSFVQSIVSSLIVLSIHSPLIYPFCLASDKSFSLMADVLIHHFHLGLIYTFFQLSFMYFITFLCFSTNSSQTMKISISLSNIICMGDSSVAGITLSTYLIASTTIFLFSRVSIGSLFLYDLIKSFVFKATINSSANCLAYQNVITCPACIISKVHCNNALIVFAILLLLE